MSNSKTNNDRLAELIFVKMMMLFDVNRINIKRSGDQVIEAIIGWPDQGQAHYDAAEEQQEVAWIYQDLSPDVSLVMEHLKLRALLRGDRIELPEDALGEQLTDAFHWENDRARRAIEGLLRVHIDMIDDGSKTDAFFLHF